MKLFLSLTNTLSFFSRSDANRNKVSGLDLRAIIFRKAACFILQSNSWVNQVNKALE